MNNKIRHLTFAYLMAILLLFSLSSVVYAQREGTILRLVVTDSFGQIKRGTGFVVSGYNYIITAYHVVQNARRVGIDRPQVLKVDNLKVIGIYPEFDIALLKIPGELLSMLVPFKPKNAGASSSKAPIAVLGYGSVLDRPQRYTGYHENAPFIPSEEWRKPASIPGKSKSKNRKSDCRTQQC